ncbi:MAG: FAD-dependent oxidoreductase [Clostridiales Family XIII bacterium]|jgi:NADPH-dependent 2,4-dienoyl-CoA reductase/sulfur reductase-like enzyme/Fe-S-cluster-containing hydrogenase component 2|nr:FAD-dependent oxidoreductase [Clostridiales Family XIII bacterium]
MLRYEMIVIGAGPAGLSAATEAARSGMQVVVFDENARPGGQLFKQIHKFFGSREHQARTRGFRIGENLLKEAEEAGVKVVLNAAALGIYKNKEIAVSFGGATRGYRADCIVIATGASENMMSFKGWTLPGVMGAGAAQTLMNIQGVRPGGRILMVGSGNVGLVVSFQLLQAGCQVEAIVDAAPRVGGYGVHASKLSRTGVPFYMSHTVVEAKGSDRVESAVIAAVDERFRPVAGTEREIGADTVCIAVGLSPMGQLADNAGCEMSYLPAKGGYVPTVSEFGETSIPGIYCAGDAAGIEEASSAMIQGKICAAAACNSFGYINDEEFRERAEAYGLSLSKLRAGMFAPQNKGRTDISHTAEGYPLSGSLLQRGYISQDEIEAFPAARPGSGKGLRPVIECTQNIPCDPCQDACAQGCISVGGDITGLPTVDGDRKCTGCCMCVAACSGQAIFLVDEDCGNGSGLIGLPYEFLPLPEPGALGLALDRSGNALCGAEVVEVRKSAAMDRTAVLMMKVPAGMACAARFFRPADGRQACRGR